MPHTFTVMVRDPGDGAAVAERAEVPDSDWRVLVAFASEADVLMQADVVQRGLRAVEV